MGYLIQSLAFLLPPGPLVRWEEGEHELSSLEAASVLPSPHLSRSDPPQSVPAGHPCTEAGHVPTSGTILSNCSGGKDLKALLQGFRLR